MIEAIEKWYESFKEDVRFDNAYYSVDKAYLHKSVMIAASATTVNIYSMKGELIVSWRRASRRGEWLTDPAHLPESYKQMSEWNATYFTRKAMTVPSCWIAAMFR